MARPISTVPAVKPIIRGKSLAISYNFRGIQFKHSLGIQIEPNHVGATGFIKGSHSQHVALNQQIEAAIDRFKLATQIAIAADTIEAKIIESEYKRLTIEAADLIAATVIANDKAEKKANRNFNLDIVEADIESDEIAELEKLLIEKRIKRDNLLRATNQYEDDKFISFIQAYVKASEAGSSTIRNYNSFIKVLTEYKPDTKIQDISEDWIIDFVDWLYITPVKIFYYHMKYEIIEGKRKLTRTDKIKSSKTLPPRLNGTISDYIMKIKSVLNYYSTRQHKLPSHVKIDMTYKNYSFNLAAKQDNVLALEWNEVCDLFAHKSFEKKTHEKARDLFCFLCATGLRQSDLKRITPDVIKDGEIRLVTQKTEQHEIKVAIPLNAISTAILNKYDFDLSTNCKMDENDLNNRITKILNYKSGDNYIFPTFQFFETLIKYRKREQVKVRNTRVNLITTHCGRKTFINYLIDNGIDVTDVMLMSGHADLNTLLVYKNKRKSMKKQLTGLFPVPKQLTA